MPEEYLITQGFVHVLSEILMATINDLLRYAELD
jgi:hypothetical protein